MFSFFTILLFSQQLGEEIEARREIEKIVEVVLEFPDLGSLNKKEYINLVTNYFNREADFSIKKLKSIDSFFIMESDPEIRSGLEHYMNGNYDLAIIKLYSQKSNPLVNLYIARCYLKNGEYDEAKRSFDEIIDTISKIDTTRLYRNIKEVIDFSEGEIEIRLGDYTKAVNRFRHFIKKYRWSPLVSNAFAYLVLAKIYLMDKGEELKDTVTSEEKLFLMDYMNLRKIKNINFHIFLRSLMETFYWQVGNEREMRRWQKLFFKILPEEKDENVKSVCKWIGYLWFQDEAKEGKIESPLNFLSSIGEGDYANLLRSLFLYNKGDYRNALEVSLDIFNTEFSSNKRWLKEVAANIIMASLLKSQKEGERFIYESEMIRFINEDIPSGLEDWRSCFLFHLGEYIYREDPIRAKDIMLKLTEDERLRYTRGYHMGLITLAWIKMQVYRFDEARESFKWVFLNTSYRESVVLAAYGLGLTNLYIGKEDNLREAVFYFHVEKIPPSDTLPTIYEIISEKRGINLENLEIIERLKPDNLWYLGQTYEALSSFLDAIDVYKYILKKYGETSRAPDASQRLVDIYAMAAVTSFGQGDYSQTTYYLKEAEKYMNIVRKYAEKLGYEEFKGYGLALSSLYRAYLDTKRESNAEKIGEEMKQKLNIKEPLETYYYIKALEDTSLTELEMHYNKLKQTNPKSKQLPEVMFKLVTMYNKHADYRKMIPILEALEGWTPYELVRLYLPDVLRSLGVAYYKIGEKDKALAKFEKFVRLYPKDKKVPPVMYTIAGIYIEKGDEARKKGLPYEQYRVYYQKAIEYLDKLKEKFSDDEFYKKNEEDIKAKRKYCKIYL